ncbi:hypothetical protein [Kitasatospora sp. NPDC093558]|uniref:hypothetical protein n=1 Tax=Kitasatospora sp. NPDC093558 TaxID=3155201 RepID=UPI003413A96A
MDLDLVVRVLVICADVIILVVMPRAFRAAFRPPLRWARVGSLVVMIGVCLWMAHTQDPAWFVAVLYVDLAVSIAYTAVSRFVGRRRAHPVEPLRLSHFLQESARFDGPQWISTMVGYTGSVFVIVEQPQLRQFAVTLLGSPCPFCFVEDQLRRILGDETSAVAQYRTHLGEGSNRHVVLKRASSAADWEVKMLTRDSYRRLLHVSACPVHGPLTTPDRSSHAARS